MSKTETKASDPLMLRANRDLGGEELTAMSRRVPVLVTVAVERIERLERSASLMAPMVTFETVSDPERKTEEVEGE
jgi:hypothetical protein